MDVSLLGWLRCPYCGGNFNAAETHRGPIERGYDVLTCYCGQYPVVAGIPILEKGTGAACQTVDEVIALIKAGRHVEALLALIAPASPTLAPAWIRSLPALKGMDRLKGLAHERALRRWRERAAALLTDQGATACELFEFYFGRGGLQTRHAYDYFAFRFGQPRHLVALSFASLIQRPKKPILDLACGFGHITRSLVQRAENRPVIGIDRGFFGLYVAKNWIAPEANYVCCEADTALPFPDGAFSAVFCSDAFHYFVNKVTSIRELKRLTRDDGLICLVVLRNALVKQLHPCLSLPPEGYQALVADMPHCLVADNDVLARYLQRQGPPLAGSADIEHLADSPTLSVVASHQPEVFHDYGPFEGWPHAAGRLSLNPLYVEDGRDELGNVCLRRTFPGAFYEEENAECKQYLPETVSVNSKLLVDLAQRKRTPEMESLIEQCVVLGMLERYR